MARVKVASMIYRDIQVFFRDYRSFILLFLTPVVIAGSIGVVYVNSQPADIKVILCTETRQSTLYYAVRQSMWDSGIFWIFEKQGNCGEEIASSIKAAETKLGIIINSFPFFEQPSDYNNTLEIIYDNSKPVGLVIQSHLSIIANQISKEIINSAIGIARDELTNTLNQVDSDISTINSHIDSLKDLRSGVAGARDDVSAVKLYIESLPSISNDLNNAVTSLDNTLAQLGSLQAKLDSAQSSLNKVQSSLQTLNASQSQMGDALSLSSTLSSIESDIALLRSSIQSSRNLISAASSRLSAGPAISQVRDAESGLTGIISELDETILLIEDSVDEISSAKNYLSQKLSEVPATFQEPVKTSIRGFFGNRNFINFMFPTIIITILMWMSVFLSSVAFIKQRNTGVLSRISISPTGTSTIILGKIFTYTIISLLFLPLIIMLGYLIFGVEISLLSIPPIIFIYTIASMMFVLQGLTIGSIVKSENSAILTSLMLVVPMMFLSGTFFPQESLPKPIKWLTPSMPINISVNLLEGFFFYQLPVDFMLSQVGRMFIYLLFYGIIAWLFLLRTIKK